MIETIWEEEGGRKGSFFSEGNRMEGENLILNSCLVASESLFVTFRVDGNIIQIWGIGEEMGL